MLLIFNERFVIQLIHVLVVGVGIPVSYKALTGQCINTAMKKINLFIYSFYRSKQYSIDPLTSERSHFSVNLYPPCLSSKHLLPLLVPLEIISNRCLDSVFSGRLFGNIALDTSFLNNHQCSIYLQQVQRGR